MSKPDALIIEADGGSRGNPGPSGSGAIVVDAATGLVIRVRLRSDLCRNDDLT